MTRIALVSALMGALGGLLYIARQVDTGRTQWRDWRRLVTALVVGACGGMMVRLLLFALGAK